MREVTLDSLLREQIKSRYETRTARREVERFHDDKFKNKILGVSNYNNPQYRVLSPNIASLFGDTVTVLPFQDMMDLVNVDLGRLENNLGKLQREVNKDIVFIGYGGMSINVLNFMSKMSGGIALFHSLEIYEPDNIDITNMFRIYKDCSLTDGSHDRQKLKLRLFTEAHLAYSISLHDEYFKHPANGKIYIGAPDLETRKLLVDKEFYFIGHHNDEVSMTYRPPVDSDMAVETYGRIDIRILFLNMLKAAEMLIYTLANDNQYKDGEEIFSYNSSTNVLKSKANKSQRPRVIQSNTF